MKPFKVVVTKASKSTYWYADKIGEVFTVTGLDDGFFKVRWGTLGCLISWGDCEMARS